MTKRFLLIISMCTAVTMLAACNSKKNTVSDKATKAVETETQKRKSYMNLSVGEWAKSIDWGQEKEKLNIENGMNISIPIKLESFMNEKYILIKTLDDGTRKVTKSNAKSLREWIGSNEKIYIDSSYVYEKELDTPYKSYEDYGALLQPVNEEIPPIELYNPSNEMITVKECFSQKNYNYGGDCEIDLDLLDNPFEGKAEITQEDEEREYVYQIISFLGKPSYILAANMQEGVENLQELLSDDDNISEQFSQMSACYLVYEREEYTLLVSVLMNGMSYEHDKVPVKYYTKDIWNKFITWQREVGSYTGQKYKGDNLSDTNESDTDASWLYRYDFK